MAGLFITVEQEEKDMFSEKAFLLKLFLLFFLFVLPVAIGFDEGIVIEIILVDGSPFLALFNIVFSEPIILEFFFPCPSPRGRADAMYLHQDFKEEEQGEERIDVEKDAAVGLVPTQKNEYYTQDDGEVNHYVVGEKPEQTVGDVPF